MIKIILIRQLFKENIFLFFLILFFFSCSQSKPEVKNEPVPDWFLSSQTEDPRYFYGSANHSNKKRAVELALKDIASFISVSIKGTSTSQSFKSGLTTGSKFSESVESEVKKIEFSNYEIENQALVNNKFYVRVKVLKQSVVQSTRDKYADADRKNKSAIERMASQNKLDQLFLFKKSEKSLTDAYNQLILLRSLKQFDSFSELDENTVQSDVLRYESYFENYQKLLNSIHILVQADTGLEPIAKAISVALSEDGIKNTIGNAGNNYDGLILTQGKVEEGEIQGFKSMTYFATLSMKNSSEKNLSTTSQKIIGYSVQSHQGAAEDASKKFVEKIKKDGGILKMMNL